MKVLILPPHHLVDYPHIALNNFHYFSGNILIDIIRHRNTVTAIPAEFHSSIDCLEERLGINAGDDEVGFVNCLRTLGAGAYADSRERMADTGEERRLLWESAGVRHYRKSIHLQAVVVVEAEGFVLNHSWIELEALCGKTVAAARMAAVEDRHIIFLCHCIDGVEETQEVLLGVDVLFSVSAEQNVFALLKSKALVNVAGLNLGKILVQNLSHRRARDVGTLLRESAVCKIAASVLAVGHIHVGNYIHNPAIGFLRQAFVLATVAGLHVEDRNMQTLCSDYAEAAVGITQNKNSVRLDCNHQLVTFRDDIAHCLAQVCTHGVHIHLRVCKLEVFEENSIEVVIVVLACMSENHVEILAAFVDDRCKTYDFRTGADNDEELEFAVLLPMYV